MRLYREGNPLRVYIDAPYTEIVSLSSYITSQYYEEPEYPRDDELRTFIFTDDESGKSYFPSGLIDIVVGVATRLGLQVDIDYEDDVVEKVPVIVPEDYLDGITLRDYQVEGIEAALYHQQGLLQLSTGAGKTEMMSGVVRYLLENEEGHIMLCVPTINLLYQTRDRLEARGIPPETICVYGDGNDIDPDKRVVVATVATAFLRLKEDPIFIDWYQNLLCLIMDECHHSAARTWFTVIEALHPKYNLGFSAEPFYNTKRYLVRDLVLRGVLGSIIFRVPMSYLIDRGHLSKPYLLAIETNYQGDIFTLNDWYIVNKQGIVTNKLRNDLIVESAVKLIDLGKDPLVLVSQIAHGVTLSKGLARKGYRVAMLQGRGKVTIYDGDSIDRYIDKEGDIKDKFMKGEVHAILGTSVMDEGVDMPVISSVILAGGGASVLKLVQRIGRGLRPSKEDNMTIILDFKDQFNVVTRSHFRRREKALIERGILSYHIKSPDEIPGLVEYFRSMQSE